MISLQPLLDSPLFDLLTQSGQASGVQKAAVLGFSIAVVLAALFFLLVVHLIMAFCFKRICEKAGHEPGILIWIPLLQLIPIFRAAKLSLWMILLLLIPFVGSTLLFWNLFQARGKEKALGLIALFPPAIPFLVLYLAFAD